MVQSLALSIPSLGSIPSPGDSPTAVADSSDVGAGAAAFAEVPITALSKSTRRQLSLLLNSRKILRSEEGYERDWRGIASLAQQKNFADEKALSADDPMAKVLQLWCTNNPKTATIANLERFLGIIDRWDVSDDIYENLILDTKNFNASQKQKSSVLARDEADTASNAPTINITPTNDFGFGSDPNILTKDDVERAQKGLPPQTYDAFILFADNDLCYASEILTKLEDNAEFNFKLCLKNRDLLAGVSFEHVALTQLIEERCKHLIVILTENFMKSEENKFLVNYTQLHQIQHKTRKIIPLLYEDSVDIPRTLKIYTHLKYGSNSNGLFNFWGKLAASIRNVNIAVETPPPIYTKDICSFTVPRTVAHKQNRSIVNLPTPTTEIPSININGNAFVPEDDTPKKKERTKMKKSPTNPQLRNAHSTSQLNAACDGGSSASIFYDHDPKTSMSNLSTLSGYSDPPKKKKKSRPIGKLFKRVFSRSSSKLQEPA